MADTSRSVVASGDLRSVYLAKCDSIGLPANTQYAKRLASMEAVRGGKVDLSGIPADATFRCAMEVLVVATGVHTVLLANCDLKQSHVDILAHHLARAVGVTRVDLSHNPGVTDSAARILIELLRQENNIADITIDDCGVSTPVQDELRRQLVANTRGGASPLEGELERDDDDHRVGMLGVTRRFRGVSFRGARDDMMLSPMSQQRQVGAVEDTDKSKLSTETVAMIRDICLTAITVCRVGVELFMWKDAPRSLVVAALCAAITGVPFVDSSPVLHSLLLVLSFGFLQRRLQRPASLTQAPKWDEEWQRRFPRLSAVVQMEANLRSVDRTKIHDGVQNTVWCLHRLMSWTRGRGRRVLGFVFFVSYLIGSYVSASMLLFSFVVFFFGYIPASTARTNVKRFASTFLNPFTSPSEVEQARLGAVAPLLEEFQFTVKVLHLHGVVVRTVSDGGFVPFVQVKYNRTAWVTEKTQEPYVWNAESTVKFTTSPIPQKLFVTIFDDVPEIAAPALQGFVIIDECTNFGQDIVVPLSVAQPERSLLHSLIEDVQKHDAASRRKFGGMRGLTDVPRSGGLSSIETPGAVLIRLSILPTSQAQQPASLPRTQANNSDAEPLIRVIPASPMSAPRRHTISPPVDVPTLDRSGRPPPLQAPEAAQEPLFHSTPSTEDQSLPRSSSVHSNLTGSSRSVYRSAGAVAV